MNTVNCCFETNKFFTFVQTRFNFCSRSSSRWQVITSGLEANENKRIESLKSLSDTCWSAHASATKVLCYNYSNIQRSLIDLSEDDNQNLSTRNEARVLSKQMDKLETALLCKYWNCVLQRFDATSTVISQSCGFSCIFKGLCCRIERPV